MSRMTLLAVALLAGVLIVLPFGAAHATCGEECDSSYASAVDDCHSQYGDDPADAEDLASCIRDARDDYNDCLDNCRADASPSRLDRSRRGVLLAHLRAVLVNAANLSPEDAAKHIGESATVCGAVASAHYAPNAKRQPTFLNLGQPYPHAIFTAVIWIEDRAKFNDAEHLQGKQVCVTGSIQRYRGEPEVILRDPKQLQPQQ
jgi:hypothetical protein